MKYLLCIGFYLFCCSGTAFANSMLLQFQDVDETYSFEDGLQGWTVRGMQINPNLPPPITQTQSLARDGSSSLKFAVNRDVFFDPIWIEKPVSLEANQTYIVNIDFSFATQDFGDANAFIILANPLRMPFNKIQDVVPAFQDFSANYENRDVGYKWLEKHYDFMVRTNEEGKLYIIVGIYGGYDVRRSYYIDNVRLKIYKKEVQPEFYSFEDDLQGWEIGGTDLQYNGSTVDWSIIRNMAYRAFDGSYSMRFDLTSLNEKAMIWMVKPITVDPRSVYKITVDYMFAPQLNGYRRNSQIFTTVLRNRPETADDLAASRIEDAERGSFTAWLHKVYSFKVKTKKSETIYIVIGVLGNEASRLIYSFDNVFFTVEKR